MKVKWESGSMGRGMPPGRRKADVRAPPRSLFLPATLLHSAGVYSRRQLKASEITPGFMRDPLINMGLSHLGPHWGWPSLGAGVPFSTDL